MVEKDTLNSILRLFDELSPREQIVEQRVLLDSPDIISFSVQDRVVSVGEDAN